jgi:hypothetical protein
MSRRLPFFCRRLYFMVAYFSRSSLLRSLLCSVQALYGLFEFVLPMSENTEPYRNSKDKKSNNKDSKKYK